MAALPREIEEKLDAVRALCVKWGIKRLALFGSAARGEFDSATSDFDFFYEFLPGRTPGLAFLTFEEELAAVLGRRVDLMDYDSISNPYLKRHIDCNPVYPVYEAA
jgi:predicted nucleotidyltransferase